MLPRPEVIHQPTFNIPATENPPGSAIEETPVPDEGDATSHLLSSSIHDSSETKGGAPLWARTSDKCVLAGSFVILVGPWVLLAIFWARKGVQMPNHLAKAVIDHPATTNFLATFLSNIVSIAVSYFFSVAVIRYSQTWVMNNDHVTVFDISLISAFRNQNWPWSIINDPKHLLVQKRWFPVALAAACVTAFSFVQPGMSSLITPVSFYRTVPLTGTEIDFSSNATDCISWFKNNWEPNCGWTTTLNGPPAMFHLNCSAETQIIDILESGRNNIQSLFSDSSESFALPQLGAHSSRHFVGPLHGVLPSDLNGLPGLNPLQSSPLADSQAKAVMLSYNYTLDHQGIAINVSCVFDHSPIEKTVITGTSNDNPLPLVRYMGSCDGLFHVFPVGMVITAPNSENLLKIWACKSAPPGDEDPTYYIYLSGRLNSALEVGNITCTVPPIQTPRYPVMYQSSKDVFSVKESIGETFGNTDTLSKCLESAIFLLAFIVTEVQTLQSNLLADLVMNIGVQPLGSQEGSGEEYLVLYAAMIQGIFMNQVTYDRFTYSLIANPGPPPSCFRPVNGTLSEEVMGWIAKPVHIAFLLPVTIINLSSLVVIIIAKTRDKRGCYDFDPSDPRPLVLAENILAKGDPSGWTDGVSYRPRQWLREKF